jgi:dienelactone hydrolase
VKLLLIALLLPATALAKIMTETVAYENDGVKMEGVLTFDDAAKVARPGIVVFSEWMGIGPFSKGKARELGYVTFAADFYGVGNNPKDFAAAMEVSSKYKKDRRRMRAHALAALEVLKRDKRVDPSKLGAMGFCFGGTVVLELAREGAPVKGVVSFHGGLEAPLKAPGKIDAKVLVLHGADDPYVPDEMVRSFQEEMRAAKADWQLVSYGNAVHSFTVPDAGNDPSKGVAFNELSAKRAWVHMRLFFATVFQ